MVLIFPRVPIVFTLSSFELRSDLAVCQSDNPFGLRTKSDQFFQVTYHFILLPVYMSVHDIFSYCSCLCNICCSY